MMLLLLLVLLVVVARGPTVVVGHVPRTPLLLLAPLAVYKCTRTRPQTHKTPASVLPCLLPPPDSKSHARPAVAPCFESC